VKINGWMVAAGAVVVGVAVVLVATRKPTAAAAVAPAAAVPVAPAAGGKPNPSTADTVAQFLGLGLGVFAAGDSAGWW
jgi:hypothetical protein